MGRYENLDFLKALALISVVLIHLKPLREVPGYEWLSFFLINTSRFAVPVFFLISGFLIREKLQEKPDYFSQYISKITKLSIKGVGVLLSLNILYLILRNGVSTSSSLIIENLLVYHLWFLPVLALSVAVVYIFHSKNQIKLLLFSAGLFHFSAILSETYMVLEFPFTGVSKLSAGLLFSSAGFLIGSGDFKKFSSRKLGLTVFFTVGLHILERLVIRTRLSPVETFYFIDYSFLTVPMAISIFLLALNLPDLESFSRLSVYGRTTFWGYILHPLFVVIFLDSFSVMDSLTVFALEESLMLSLLGAPFLYFAVMETVVRLQRNS